MITRALTPLPRRPHRGGPPLPVVSSVVAAIAVLSSSPCFGQAGTLKEKLKDLNVRLTTDHYVLAGTVSDTRLNMYAQALEYIHREYAKGFSEVLKDEEKESHESGAAKKRSARGSRRSKRRSTRGAAQPPEEPQRSMDQEDQEGRFPVIVFNNRQQYLDFGRAFLAGGSEHSIGMYIPAAKLLLIEDQGNFEDTNEVLFHEAFHQFVHRYLKNAPTWLNEGLATHYGYARPTGGGLSFSRPPAIRWQLTRKLIEKNLALPLWQVVSANRAAFYGKMPVHVPRFERVQQSDVYYAQAYTLVHTLLSDRTGRERLRDYIRELAADDGSKAAAITQKYFGPDTCEHMTPFWIKHVNSRPENR